MGSAFKRNRNCIGDNCIGVKWNECEYNGHGCIDALLEDALALLKAQEPVVRCKDCKHRPILDDALEIGGFGLEFPDYHCPCRCDDGYYSRMPEDDWYCPKGERNNAG